MHFGFDVEFMTRLALLGESPLLLQDQELAACVLHSGAKSADQSKWVPEFKAMRREHREMLDDEEKAALRAIERGRQLDPVLRPLRRVSGFLRFRVLHPLIRTGGRILDLLPERVRPGIRTRDRKQP
jgi:hypothetical protein